MQNPPLSVNPASQTGQALSFPLYRFIQFALFVRYYLQSLITDILRDDLNHPKMGSYLLEGFPKHVGLNKYALAPSDSGLIWIASERAALFFVEGCHHQVMVDYIDNGTLEMLIQSYNLRSVELMKSMNRENSLAVVSVGAKVFNQYPYEFNSGIYLMLESIRYHLSWLNRVIDPRNLKILQMLQSEQYADEEYSRMFVEHILGNENFKRQAQQLVQEVASTVLVGAFQQEGLAAMGFYRLYPQQLAVLQSRFFELLKLKFRFI